jgi:hypothetical protein
VCNRRVLNLKQETIRLEPKTNKRSFGSADLKCPERDGMQVGHFRSYFYP